MVKRKSKPMMEPAPVDEELFEESKPVEDAAGEPVVVSKPGMIFVAIYPTDHEALKVQPGDIIEVMEEDFMLWSRDLERSQARMVMSQEEALALSASILDGTFVLSPEVSQTPHSMAHGGFGTPKEK